MSADKKEPRQKAKTKKGKVHEADTLYRHMLILQMIPRRNRISTETIMSRLAKEHLITIDIRTIQRNLNSLSRVFPIMGDGNRPQGWSWAPDAPVFDVPNIDPQTALTFNLVERFIKGLVPRATLVNMAPYFKNAEAILNGGAVGVLGRWPEKVQVLNRGEVLRPPTVDDNVMANIYDALFNEVRCSVDYRPIYNNQLTHYEVNPLGLVFVGKIPYLVATLWGYKDIKQLPLHRMEKVELLGKPVTPLEGFTLDGYIKSGEFSYPVNQGEMRLVIQMVEERARHLRETPLSSDQKIGEPDREGWVAIEATVQDTMELRFWLKGFGADLVVVEPPGLRDEFAENAEALNDHYN